VDTQSATVIHLNQPRCTPKGSPNEQGELIWKALERNERRRRAADELSALRAALLDHWAELHHLKCRCDLSLGMECRAPLPPELRHWLQAQRRDQKTV
jgi:hypothetical protein